MKYNYIFGPVNSRRLGVSLGIDLLPYKTCSFDCVYCECGCTTALVSERSEYVSTDEVVQPVPPDTSKTSVKTPAPLTPLITN